MQTSLIKKLAISVLLLSASFATAQAGDSHSRQAYYEISVSNLTRAQILSPFVVSTHRQPFSLFTLGQEASPELAALAQDALTNGLFNLVSTDPSNRQALVSSGPTLPGQTTVIEIPARGGRYLSMAAMLVTTNDAFTGLNNVRVSGRFSTYRSVAYDAGSENNDELCAYIPGPPCGNPEQSSGEAGEGYVYVNSGIQGVGDLDSSFDWRNPVTQIRIKRIWK